MNCKVCEYKSNHECKKAACCKDADCDDQDFSTKDSCLNSGSKSAVCEHEKISNKNSNTCIDGTSAGKCSKVNLGYICMEPFMELQPATFCEGFTPQPRAAKTDFKLLIVEFTQADIKLGEEVNGNNLIDFINNPAGYEYLPEPYGRNIYSFFYAKEWFESQAQRYGADITLKIDIVGPFDVKTSPPARGFYDVCNMLESYFDEETKRQGIDVTRYDGISYIYIQNEDRIFWPCASGNKNYVVIDWAENKNVQILQYVQTVIHELGHNLGATDKYVGRSCMAPEGIPEPDKIPKYPQNKACLMCGTIRLNEKGSGLEINDFSQLIVCDKSAKEMGWIQ